MSVMNILLASGFINKLHQRTEKVNLSKSFLRGSMEGSRDHDALGVVPGWSENL